MENIKYDLSRNIKRKEHKFKRKKMRKLTIVCARNKK